KGASRCGKLPSAFRCYEEYGRAKALVLRFKLENVMRDERFALTVNGKPITPGQQKVRYAANGRDTRVHTVTLEPYLEFEVRLQPAQVRRGDNRLEVTPKRLIPQLTATIQLREIELEVCYE